MKKHQAVVLLASTAISGPVHATELEDGVVIFQIEGADPANPALLDTKGDFTERFLLNTRKMSSGRPGGAPAYVGLNPVLHRTEAVCEGGTATISDTDSGKLIVKSLIFYQAHRADSGALSCDRVGPTKDVPAPTLEHFLAARWAVDALKQPLKNAFMDDPFCQLGQFGRCSTASELGIILDTARLSLVKSCTPALSNCVRLTVFFDLKETRSDGIHTTFAGREFRVEYQRGKVGRRLKSYTFNNLQMPIPSAPPRVPAEPSKFPIVREIDQIGGGAATLVRFNIDKGGKVFGCTVLEPSGSANLDENACKIIDKGKFRPTINDRGKPVPTYGKMVRIRWNIEE